MIQQTPQPNLKIPLAVSAVLSRLASILIFAGIFGYIAYGEVLGSSVMSKAAALADRAGYLADKAGDFGSIYGEPLDLFVIIAVILVTVLIAGLILVGYELVALGIRKLIAEPIVKGLFRAA